MILCIKWHLFWSKYASRWMLTVNTIQIHIDQNSRSFWGVPWFEITTLLFPCEWETPGITKTGPEKKYYLTLSAANTTQARCTSTTSCQAPRDFRQRGWRSSQYKRKRQTKGTEFDTWDHVHNIVHWNCVHLFIDKWSLIWTSSLEENRAMMDHGLFKPWIVKNATFQWFKLKL